MKATAKEVETAMQQVLVKMQGIDDARAIQPMALTAIAAALTTIAVELARIRERLENTNA